MILTLAALGSCGKLNTASNSLVWTMPQHLKHKAFYYRKEKRWSILALIVNENLIALRFATQKLTINEH